MKYVQSFYPYAVVFSSIGKGVPSRNADGELRNIVELSDEEYEKLQNSEPLFRKLLNQKKYRVLNKIPESYRPASTLVNEARAEATSLKSENEELKQKLAEYEAKLNGTSNDSRTVEGEANAEINVPAPAENEAEKPKSKKSESKKD